MSAAHAVLMRLDAPLMSFGGVVVDGHGVTDVVPGPSWLAGLLGNALGYAHRADALRLGRLQERLRYAVRLDAPGETIVDYQTVDLGAPGMDVGWTTRDRPEGRNKSANATGTHVRRRHYLADAVYTLAVALAPAHETPDVHRLATALRRPARPLFLGRQCCPPAGRLLLDVAELRTLDGVPRLRELLERTPRAPLGARARRPARAPIVDTMRAWWPLVEGACGVAEERDLAPPRDWESGLHGGRAVMFEGTVAASPREQESGRGD